MAGTTSAGPDSGPDFRHVRAWLFDLDNTLYRADCGVFAQIESRMTDYVARFTGLGRDEARASTRWNGSRRCPWTRSSSSYQASIGAQ